MPLNTRRAIDRLQPLYGLLVAVQATALVLYDLNDLPRLASLAIGSVTSLVGPLLSFVVSVHVFRHRHRSKGLDLATVGLTYIFTCVSFGVIYAIIADEQNGGFNLPQGSTHLDLGSALYFSFVTITTTGFGDISPASGLARLATCWEIGTGLLYQVFVFSLAASILGVGTSAENTQAH